ncbi:hypothetical protein DFJ43DRAFT_1043969, partial [Lentinula guzmanii]
FLLLHLRFSSSDSERGRGFNQRLREELHHLGSEARTWKAAGVYKIFVGWDIGGEDDGSGEDGGRGEKGGCFVVFFILNLSVRNQTGLATNCNDGGSIEQQISAMLCTRFK